MTAVAQAATRTKPAYRPSQDFVAEVLAGDLLAIARMITRAETGIAEAGPALAEIYRHAGKAHVIGITGVPVPENPPSCQHSSRHLQPTVTRSAWLRSTPAVPIRAAQSSVTGFA